jgi:hypothetical protein
MIENNMIQTIVYPKPIDSHYCDIHKETFIFLRTIYHTKKREQYTKSFMRMLKFIYKRSSFTKKDIRKELRISHVTLNKYFRFLTQLKLCYTKKRSMDEIKNKNEKQYVFVFRPYLREVLLLLKCNFVCPIFMMSKDTTEYGLFNKMQDFVNQKQILK